MSDSNLSAVVFERGVLKLVDRPIPQAGPGEVQIAVQKVGICGSDVKVWKDGHVGPYVLTKPILLGHEVSGIVSQVGKGVKHLKIGDRVAVDPHIPCRICGLCKSGRYNICPEVSFLATPPDDGALARFFVHSADMTFKLPDNVTCEEGAMVEPLSVGLHACRSIGVALGHSVLITGAGPIGICTMMCAKAIGAKVICMTDVDQKRLNFVRAHGATHTILIGQDDTPEGVVPKIKDLMGDLPDRAVECSGSKFGINMVVHAVTCGGAVALVGIGAPNVSFPVNSAITKELKVIGSLRYVNTWPTVIDMLSDGKINIKPMITHNFNLEETLDAFDMAKSGMGIKVMVNCSRE